MRAKIACAPSHPSLSWIAPTPRCVRELDARARRVDELVLGDDDVAVAEAPRRLLAQDARRLAGAVALDDAPVDVQVAPGAGEPRGVDPERVVVLRPERRRSLARDRVERLARGMLRPERVAPAAAADPLAPPRMRLDARERLGERGCSFELDVSLRQRPRREVDVCVGERRQDAAAPQVDAIRGGEGGLVRPDAAGDAIPGDRECRRGRQRRVHRADDAVRDDHARSVDGVFAYLLARRRRPRVRCEARNSAPRARGPAGMPGPRAVVYAAGRMFWFTRKTLSGSYAAFTRARRA